MPLYKSVNLSSPGPIGATTPDTGAFTTLSATPPANTTAFNSTGFSLTGANAQTLFNLAGTWNTSGTPTAFKLNVTDTASNASSLLMDLQVGGTSQFYIRKDGFAFLNNSFGTFLIGNNSSNSVGIGRAGGALTLLIQGGSTQAVNLNGSYITFQASTVIQWSSDLTIFRDAADILAQRRTTNAQTFRLYNTYTDASNYERGFMRWATNVLEIGAEAAGTGTQRQLRFPLGTVTASTPLSITQTWNSAGVTFTGIQANITDTASNASSLLMDLQVGGTSTVSITKAGLISSVLAGTRAAPTIQIRNANSGIYSAASGWIGIACAGVSPVQFASGGLYFTSSAVLGWTNQVNDPSGSGSHDLSLFRDAADILAQRRTTTSQTFRLYRTFTDSSNYERISLIATRTTRFAIAAENAGTGAARSLEISFYTSASDPASTDITDGCFSVWKNSGTGTIKLWANDGGTMKSVALA